MKQDTQISELKPCPFCGREDMKQSVISSEIPDTANWLLRMVETCDDSGQRKAFVDKLRPYLRTTEPVCGSTVETGIGIYSTHKCACCMMREHKPVSKTLLEIHTAGKGLPEAGQPNLRTCAEKQTDSLCLSEAPKEQPVGLTIDAIAILEEYRDTCQFNAEVNEYGNSESWLKMVARITAALESTPVRESVAPSLAEALRQIHDYAKGKSLDDGFFIERCAYTALSRLNDA